MSAKNAVGGFFSRIWRWIKETAWIQPLLIVGLIFGVIFSIPPIVKAVKENKANSNSEETFYRSYQISLKENQASNFTQSILKLSEQKQKTPELSFDELVSKVQEKDPDFHFEDEKFFLVYVSKTCDGCTKAREPLEKLKNGLGTSSYPLSEANAGEEFKMHTIFADEGDKDEFEEYLNSNNHFFELAAEVGGDAEYRLDIDSTAFSTYETGIEALQTFDPESFLTPTILLIDFTENAATNKGISEVLFGIPKYEASSKEKTDTETLLDCWNTEGIFAQK